MDEFHLMLRDPETAKYTVEIYKRFRKWGGVPSALTQNVKDLLKNPQIENILENARFIALLNQGPGDRTIIGERLQISAHQLNYVKDVGPGEGLLICDGTIVPFMDKFPKNTTLYRLMSTRPNENFEV